MTVNEAMSLEAAFEAADRHGIYLQVDLPNWTFEMGRRPAVDAFLKRELGALLPAAGWLSEETEGP